MGFDFNKNGIDDKEDLIIFEEMENEGGNGNITLPAVVVVVIIGIFLLYIKIV